VLKPDDIHRNFSIRGAMKIKKQIGNAGSEQIVFSKLFRGFRIFRAALTVDL
jgi:hypothetical protein